MAARKVSGEIAGRAYAYARTLLTTPGNNGPFSRIVVQTIAQDSWKAGYKAALRDKRKGRRTP